MSDENYGCGLNERREVTDDVCTVLAEKYKSVLQRIESIKSGVCASQYFWVSKNSGKFRQYYAEDTKEFEKLVSEIRKRIKTLGEISPNAQNKGNKNFDNSLPDSILE